MEEGCRPGLSDRRILAGDPSFNSGSICSEAESVCDPFGDDLPDVGRREAATPEPLLPSNGERGCFSRGGSGACSEIFPLR